MPFLFVSSGGSEQDLESVLRRIFSEVTLVSMGGLGFPINMLYPIQFPWDERYIYLHEWLIMVFI